MTQLLTALASCHQTYTSLFTGSGSADEHKHPCVYSLKAIRLGGAEMPWQLDFQEKVQKVSTCPISPNKGTALG